MGSEMVLGNIFCQDESPYFRSESNGQRCRSKRERHSRRWHNSQEQKAIILAAPDAGIVPLAVNIMGVLIYENGYSFRINKDTSTERGIIVMLGTSCTPRNTRQGAPLDEAAATLWTVFRIGISSDFNRRIDGWNSF